MKNKTCKFIMAILWISLIIVITLLIIRYGGNYLNEVEIKKELIDIEGSVSTTFKGYEVEGILEIPAINIKYPIINTTNEEAMKISVTKLSGPKINEVGNYCIAGHNNRDGTMFGKTKYLKVGDSIKLTNLHNETIEYKIFQIYTVDPNDVSCTNSVDENSKELTLITCTNGHKNRLITKARQII